MPLPGAAPMLFHVGYGFIGDLFTAAQHIKFIFPRKRDSGPPTLQGNAGKFREIRGFLRKNIVVPRKRPIREIQSGDPKWAFWGDFAWRMNMAKVDMLGTGEDLLGVK